MSKELTALAEGLRILAPVELPTGRHQAPSERAVRAVEIYAENGGNKGDALREAGYPESTALRPSKVFASPTVQAMLKEIGVGSSDALKAIKRNMNKRRVEHMVFPVFNTQKAGEREEMDEESGGDSSEKIRGEQLTDKQIRDMYTELGIVVKQIVHGETCRHVYYWVDDSKAQLTAADMMLNVEGTYAPKQIVGKHDHRVGIFSYTELRAKQKREGIRIT